MQLDDTRNSGALAHVVWDGKFAGYACGALALLFAPHNGLRSPARRKLPMTCLERAANREFGTICRGSQVCAKCVKRVSLLGHSLWLQRFRTRAPLDSEGALAPLAFFEGRRRILIISEERTSPAASFGIQHDQGGVTAMRFSLHHGSFAGRFRQPSGERTNMAHIRSIYRSEGLGC